MACVPNVSFSWRTRPARTALTTPTESIKNDPKLSTKAFFITSTPGACIPPISLLQLKNTASFAAPGRRGFVVIGAEEAAKL